MTTIVNKPSGLLRRLAACLYDFVLLFGILFFLTLFITIGFEKITGVPLNEHPLAALHHAIIYLVAFIYFGWFWTHPGQTLGMKAWKLQIISTDGSRITWFQAFLRYIGTIISVVVFGMGFIWGAFGRKATWHDLLSGSRLVITSRTNKTSN